MPRSEKSIAVPTGMIIAALYVVLLVGFSRESYMRRDAVRMASLKWPDLHKISDQACRMAQPVCETLFAGEAERQICSASIEAMNRADGPAESLTLRDLQQALGDAR